MRLNQNEERVNSSTVRLQVPGGWMVTNSYGHENNLGTAYSQSSIFISDQNYQWELDPVNEPRIARESTVGRDMKSTEG